MENALKAPSVRSPTYVTPERTRSCFLRGGWEPRGHGVPGRRARLRREDVTSGLGAERWFDSGDSFDYAANSLLRLRNGDSSAILFPCCELQYIKDCEALNTM